MADMVFRKSYGAAIRAGIAFGIAGLFLWMELTYRNTGTMVGETVIAVFTVLGVASAAWFWFRPDLYLDPEAGTISASGESVPLESIRGVVLEPDFEGDDASGALVALQILTGNWIILARQFGNPDLDVDDVVTLSVFTGPDDGTFEDLASEIDDGGVDRPESRLRDLSTRAGYETPISVKAENEQITVADIARRAADEGGAPLVDLTGTETEVDI